MGHDPGEKSLELTTKSSSSAGRSTSTAAFKVTSSAANVYELYRSTSRNVPHEQQLEAVCQRLWQLLQFHQLGSGEANALASIADGTGRTGWCLVARQKDAVAGAAWRRRCALRRARRMDGRRWRPVLARALTSRPARKMRWFLPNIVPVGPGSRSSRRQTSNADRRLANRAPADDRLVVRNPRPSPPRRAPRRRAPGRGEQAASPSSNSLSRSAAGSGSVSSDRFGDTRAVVSDRVDHLVGVAVDRDLDVAPAVTKAFSTSGWRMRSATSGSTPTRAGRRRLRATSTPCSPARVLHASITAWRRRGIGGATWRAALLARGGDEGLERPRKLVRVPADCLQRRAVILA